MMSESYFPWRRSHQLHCSRKPWSVLWATLKKREKKSSGLPDFCARISAGRSTLASGTTHKRSDFTQRTEHGCITFPWNRLLLCCRSVCFPSFLLYFLIVSVMKGSMLIQDEEIICWPPGDYKATLLLMSWSPDF